MTAAGTEFGPTDYDGYGDGGFVLPGNLIRIDIGADQIARRPVTVGIQADCAEGIEALLSAIRPGQPAAKDGEGSRGRARRQAARPN
ncbi:hypothetical protein ACVOMV_09320 [Mesorhizobium atlanticum]